MEEIKLQNVKSLIPPIYYNLSRLKEGGGSYRYYQTRHPGGVFAINFSDVMDSYNKLAKEVGNLQAQEGGDVNEDNVELKKLTTDFLFRLINYFESGYEIFLTFCPESEKPSPGLPLYKWFNDKANAEVIKNYFDVIDPLIKRYRKFFNGLKHSSNQISIYYFFKQGSGRVMGFYLEGVSPDGAICPVSELHPMFDGVHTAWSYNFHLRIFYYLIYKIAIEIENTVKKLCVANNIVLPTASDPLVKAGVELLCETAFATANRFKGAYNLFYAQESAEVTKNVELSADIGAIYFLDYSPKPQDCVHKGVGYKGALRSRGDGFSRSWTFLYMK